MITQIIINFSKVCRGLQDHITQFSNKLLGSTKPELWTQEVEELSFALYDTMGQWAVFAHQSGCCNISI